jgi:hypothetical protein
MAARGFLGAGDLYIARYDPLTAQFGDYVGPYEATKFEIKPNTELKEATSRGRSTYGQVVESVAIQQPTDFTVDLAEVNKESLTIALLGTSTTLTQGSGTVSNSPITAKLEAWKPLPNQNLAVAGLVVTNSAGTTTYALGSDYEINYRLGWIKAKAGGAITEGQAILVDYAYNAISGTLIAGGTNAQVRAKFKLDGVNFADNLPVIVEVYEGIISADAAFDFLSSDFATVSLPGRMKTPVGRSEPFVVELRDTAA